MNNFPFDAVGFDLDGTLLDTFRDLGEAVNHALEAGGFARVNVETSKDLIGGGAKIMLAQAVEAQGGIEGGLEGAAFKSLYKQMLSYYSKHNAVHTAPYPHLIECLDTLAARGVKMVVVTNKFEEFARSILSQLGLESRFEAIIGGNSLGKDETGKFIAKPAPDPILHARDICSDGSGVHARFAFIGDSSYDVNAAKAAGVPVIVAAYGYCDKPANELGGNAVIDSLDQFIPALESL